MSLKELLDKVPKEHSCGVLTFRSSPQIVIANRFGEIVDGYKGLSEIVLDEEEKEFIKTNWEATLKQHPSFYDGHVTAIIDVLYEEGSNTLTFIMDQTRYSVVAAISKSNYPNKSRIKDFISFGVGLMSNLNVAPDYSFLMVKRSQKVYTEKGAISVPGGSVEYKEDANGDPIKDDIKDGFKKSALGELEEEVLPKEFVPGGGAADYDEYQKLFNTEVTSISWERKPNGLMGLNTYFDITPKKPINRLELYNGFKYAKDRDESTGEFYFVDPGINIADSGDGGLNATPLDMISSNGLKHSGAAALSSAVVRNIANSYERGVYSGLPPRFDGFANYFKLPGFTILDLSAICRSTIPKSLIPNTNVLLIDSPVGLANSQSSVKIRGTVYHIK
jgi:hypothetical protein